MSQDEYTLEQLQIGIADCERRIEDERTTGSERRTLKWELAYLKKQFAERGDSK